MKKRILVLISIFFILMMQPVSYALGIDVSRIGIKGGLNISNYANSIRDYENKYGFCIGAFATFDFYRFISIQPELLYTQMGGRTEQPYTGEDSPDPIGTFWWNEHLEYLQIPVLVKLSIAPKSRVNGFLLLGPAVSFKLHAAFRIDEPFVASGNLESVKNTNIAMIFGGGLEFKIFQKYISLEGRYVMGLSEFDEHLEDKHKVISAIVGISF